MQKVILLFLFLFGKTIAIAQTSEHGQSIPRLSAKFMAAALFNPFNPAVEFGLEGRLSKRWTLQSSYGSISAFYNENNNRHGYRVLLEARYFVIDLDKNKEGLFVGAQSIFRQLKIDDDAVLDRFNGSFQQQIPFEARQNSWYSHLILGTHLHLDRRFFMNFKAALGVRTYRQFDRTEIPEDAVIVGDGPLFSWIDERTSGWHSRPSIRFSLTLGVVLMK